MEASRLALFGYRLQFSPETQPIRETVLDQVVLRNVMGCGRDDGASLGTLNSVTVEGKELATLTLDDTRAALSRLESSGLVRSRRVRKKQRWLSTDEARASQTEASQEVAEKLDRVLTDLYGDQGTTPAYRDCFVDCISRVFDALAADYVEALVSATAAVQPPVAVVDDAVRDAIANHPHVDGEVFGVGLKRFLGESTPEMVWLKWMYCRNYYAVRALGLGGAADPLSESLFRGSVFYLDTNVVLKAADNTTELYRSVVRVLSALSASGASVCVLDVTIAELELVVEHQGEDLDRVLAQIPDGLIGSVDSMLARAEAEYRRDATAPSPAEVLGEFANAEVLVVDRLGVEVVATETEDEVPSGELMHLAEKLKTHYDERTYRRKTMTAALHDARVLRWMDDQFQRGQEASFLTLDASLPSFRWESARGQRSCAVSLHAILPWLGAVQADDDEVANAFSALLASQLMDGVQTFSLGDFRLLAALEMECGQMPAADVKACLVYLRREARHLDVTKAEDREKLRYHVSQFFSSPDREYKARVAQLEDELDRRARRLREAEERRKTEAQLAGQQIEAEKKAAMKARAQMRIVTVGLCWVLAMVLVAVFVVPRAGEANWVANVATTSWVFAVVTLLAVIAIRWTCRGELWPEARRTLWLFGRD